MKRYKLFRFLLPVIVLGLLGQSCNNFEDLNTNPAASTKADPKSLIAKVTIHYSGDRETVWRSTAGYHMAFVQMVSDGWAISNGQKYNVIAGYPEYMWRSMYSYINDLQLAINASEGKPEMINYVAVARVLKALYFSQLTDTYGDIPYFEAVSGYDKDVMWPKYDSQRDIYYDLFKELDEAVQQFDPDMKLESDLLFDGNIEKWKKFANSLHLRLALRLVNVEEDKARAEAEKALAGRLMESSADNGVVYHGNYDISSSNAIEIRGNGFSQVQHFNDEIVVACATYSDYLRDNKDPRLEMIFGVYGAYVENVSSGRIAFKSTNEMSAEVTKEWKEKYGDLIGFPPGKFVWDPTEDEGITWDPFFLKKNGKDVQIDKYFKALQIRRELNRFDAPFIYMSYAEVELLKAEANVRWGIAGDAKEHVLNAVNAGIDDIHNILRSPAASVADINAYLHHMDEMWDTTDHLEVINMQHYVNFFFNGIEAFANWRRSGYPKLVPAYDPAYTDPNLNGLIPRRIPYPDSEMQYNRENLEPHLDEGKNFWGAPVWWDGDKMRGVILN